MVAAASPFQAYFPIFKDLYHSVKGAYDAFVQEAQGAWERLDALGLEDNGEFARAMQRDDSAKRHQSCMWALRKGSADSALHRAQVLALTGLRQPTG